MHQKFALVLGVLSLCSATACRQAPAALTEQPWTGTSAARGGQAAESTATPALAAESSSPASAQLARSGEMQVAVSVLDRETLTGVPSLATMHARFEDKYRNYTGMQLELCWKILQQEFSDRTQQAGAERLALGLFEWEAGVFDPVDGGYMFFGTAEECPSLRYGDPKDPSRMKRVELPQA
jgi:hypothetical protein